MMPLTPCLKHTLDSVVKDLLAGDRRVLLFGEPGSGKSTLAAELAAGLGRAGSTCFCIGADPGSPAFGVPGAVCRGEWTGGAWRTVDMEALCSLDAGRFRLPLLDAARRLADIPSSGTVIIDSPGVVRSVSGAELLVSLVTAARVDTILCINRSPDILPLHDELAASGCELWVMTAAEQARRPSKKARARARTRLWDTYLSTADEYSVELDRMPVLGTPPPANADQRWIGRQVGLLGAGQQTLALAEVIAKDGNQLRLCHPPIAGETKKIVVRDARRLAQGVLGTAEADAARTVWYTPPPDMLAHQMATRVGGPRPVLHVGSATATLVNGVFGDPLLHLRLRHRKRSLLFDLGEAGRLPARVAHQVTDVFISHAHFDHIAGFLWLLRSRIGVSHACRLYGPPGLMKHIESFINAIHWDRIGEGGPHFVVTELHGDRLVRASLKVGRTGAEPLDGAGVEEGLLLDEPDFRVRATTLDHGIPVLAFAVESPRTLNVRKDQLEVMGLPAGHWLGKLKTCIARDDRTAPVQLPDGRSQPAAVLAEQLLLIKPGEKLVYATDLADTPDNRTRLTRLAQGAHTFFCEAVFTRDNISQAKATGHLTARACGEIATAAGVERLIPFHFSRRYEEEPETIYHEVAAACPRMIMPRYSGS